MVAERVPSRQLRRSLQMDDRYWPFPVLPSDQQTPLHKQQVAFLEAAYAEGFRPFWFGADNYQATAADRGGIILLRTRRFWEVAVGTTDSTSLSAYVDSYAVAGEAVLRWLRGGRLADILEFIHPHLVRPFPSSTGYTLSDADET
jgi:hypothetical protein